MPKIMEIIERETKGKSYHTYKYSYDSIGVPSIDYDDDPNKIMKWKDSGETGAPKKPINLKPLADQLQDLGETPLLKYFLDGSRHVFKVDDIAYNKQVFPVVAGQIGIGCCKRENKRMSKERFYRELVLALPDKANADGWNDTAYFAAKVKKLNESEELKRLGLHFSAIIPYSTSRAAAPDGKLDNLAVGVIQDYMIEAEKRMVAELVKDKCLGQDAFLLKDGSLEYKVMKSGREDLRTLQKIKHNYNWVIGVSKSFNPESCLDHTGKPNSNYIADLPVFHRTPVARYENREFLGDVQFGVWYVRLRDKRRTQTPFDGVVKVEKIMMDEEIESGIDLGFCQNALFHNNYFMIYRKLEFSPSAFEKSFTAFVIRKDEYQKRTRGGCFRFISLRSGIARRTLFCTASQSISISAQVAISRRSSLMRAVSACICSERSAWASMLLTR